MNIIAYIILAASLVAVAGSLLVLGSPEEFPLNGKSFSTLVVVDRQKLRKKGSVHYWIHETYSADQRRGRVEPHLKEGRMTLAHSMFYDAIQDVAVAYNKRPKKCVLIDGKYYYREIFRDSPELDDLYALIDDTGPSVRHIFGMSKLLYLPSKREKDFTLKDDTMKTGSYDSLVFRMQYKPQTSQDVVTIIVSYKKNPTVSTDKYLSTQIPMYFIIFVGETFEIRLNFKSLQINGDHVFTEYTDLSNAASDKFVDENAFPAVDCGDTFPANSYRNIFEDYQMDSRFSFSAKVELAPHMKQIDHFVAFDGLENVLRMDTRHGMTDEHSYDSKNIFDFRFNKRYFTFQDIETRAREVDDELQVEDTASRVTQGRCATAIISRDTKKADEPDFANFIVGADKFFLVGRARVRGLDALMYQATSDILPQWLSPTILLKEAAGREDVMQWAPHQVGKKSDSMAGGSDKYRVVLFVADDPSGLVRPLLAEYYFGNALSIKVEYYDFAWDLRDSPDGDRVDQLFSLEDVCSNEASHYAEIDMILTEDEQVSDRSRPTWLENYLRRNTAMRAVLKEALKLRSVMIYDLSTRLKRSLVNDRSMPYQVYANFRIAEHPELVMEVTHLGRGRLASGANSLLIPAPSPDYCFYLVMSQRLRRPVQVFYFDPDNFCVIEYDVASQTSKFVIDPRGGGDIFQIDGYTDSRNFDHTWIRDAKVVDFEGKLMKLYDKSEDSVKKSKTDTQIGMRIASMNIRTFNFMSDMIGMQAKALSGYSIDPKSYLAKLVEPPKKKLDSNYEVRMTLERCEAACLSDAQCNSYSFCNRWPDYSCITSHYPILSRESLKAINSSTKNDKTIVMNEAEKDRQIRISKDLMCGIYSKNIMNMFNYVEMNYDFIDLKNSLLLPTGSLENCAELCLQKTLDSMFQADNIHQRVELLRKTPSRTVDMVKALMDEHRQVAGQICHSYGYFSTASLDQRQLDELAKFGEFAKTPGYCVIRMKREIEDGENLGKSSSKLPLQEFKFDFFKLYERSSGIRLIQSKLTEAEWAAQNRLYTNDATQSDYKTIMEATDHGKNFQWMDLFSHDDCPEKCFMQTTGLWPACRSFDTHIVLDGEHTNYVSCEYNTASVSNIDNLDRLAVTRNMDPRYLDAHYEFRFANSAQMAETSMELNEMRDTTSRFEASKLAASSIGSFGTFVVVLSSLIVGLLAGILSARKVRAYVSGDMSSTLIEPTRLEL